MFGKWLLRVAVLYAGIQVCSCLLCYWCSGVGEDRECELRPNTVRLSPPFQNCSSKYCIVAKVVDKESITVKSFARGCDNVDHGNICIKDTHTITCYQTCDTDLCNFQNPDPSTVLFVPEDTYLYSKPRVGYDDGQKHEHGVGQRFRMKDFPWDEKAIFGRPVLQDQTVATQEFDTFHSLRRAYRLQFSPNNKPADHGMRASNTYTADYGRVNPFLPSEKIVTTPSSIIRFVKKVRSKQPKVSQHLGGDSDDMRSKTSIGDSSSNGGRVNPYIDQTTQQKTGMTQPNRVRSSSQQQDDNWRSSFRVISLEKGGEERIPEGPRSPFANKDIYEKFQYLLKRHNDSNGELLRELTVLGEKLGPVISEPDIELYRIIMDEVSPLLKKNATYNGQTTVQSTKGQTKGGAYQNARRGKAQYIKDVTFDRDDYLAKEHPSSTYSSVPTGQRQNRVSFIKERVIDIDDSSHSKYDTATVTHERVKNRNKPVQNMLRSPRNNKSPKRRHIKRKQSSQATSEGALHRQFPSAYSEYRISRPTKPIFISEMDQKISINLKDQSKRKEVLQKGQIRSPFTKFAYMQKQPPIKLINYVRPTVPPLKLKNPSPSTYDRRSVGQFISVYPNRDHGGVAKRVKGKVEGVNENNPFNGRKYGKEEIVGGNVITKHFQSPNIPMHHDNISNVAAYLPSRRQLEKINHALPPEQATKADRDRQTPHLYESDVRYRYDQSTSKSPFLNPINDLKTFGTAPWVSLTDLPVDDEQTTNSQEYVKSLVITGEQMAIPRPRKGEKLKRNIENTSTVKNVISKPTVKKQIDFVPTDKAVAKAFRGSPFSKQDFKLVDVVSVKSFTSGDENDGFGATSTLAVLANDPERTVFDNTVESRPLTREVSHVSAREGQRSTLHRHDYQRYSSTKSYGFKNSCCSASTRWQNSLTLVLSVLSVFSHLFFS